jgi:hypothetical protein
MAVACAIGRMVFVAGVLVLPVLADGVGDFDKPSAVFGGFQNIGSRKKLCAVLRGIAERLEQPRGNQRGNVMRLAVQHPTGLLRRETEGQLAEQRQEPRLIFFHTQDQSPPRPKPNRRKQLPRESVKI